MNRNKPSRLDYTLKNWRWWVLLPIMTPLAVITVVAVFIQIGAKFFASALALIVDPLVEWSQNSVDNR